VGDSPEKLAAFRRSILLEKCLSSLRANFAASSCIYRDCHVVLCARQASYVRTHNGQCIYVHSVGCVGMQLVNPDISRIREWP
jgi:hypothetical protein